MGTFFAALGFLGFFAGGGAEGGAWGAAPAVAAAAARDGEAESTPTAPAALASRS